MKLWLLSMPGLTGDLLLQEAEKLGLFIHGQMVNLSRDQWNSLELACRKRLDLPDDWSLQQYNKALTYAQSMGFGTLYGPIGPMRKRRRMKEPREGEQVGLFPPE